MVTLAGERGLLLVGEPGTAKSMLSELLAAAISGTSALQVQGTAGTTAEHLRYGGNYALLLARGPQPEALVPSPVRVSSVYNPSCAASGSIARGVLSETPQMPQRRSPASTSSVYTA